MVWCNTSPSAICTVDRDSPERRHRRRCERLEAGTSADGRSPVPASERAIELALAAAQAAGDKKANDIVILDVADRLVITDAFLVASAPNERQVQAIVDAIEERLVELPEKAKPVRREGERAGRGASGGGRVCWAARWPSAIPRSTRAGRRASRSRAAVSRSWTTWPSGRAWRCRRRPTWRPTARSRSSATAAPPSTASSRCWA